MLTSQGLMTAADLYDHQLLHDLHMHPDCPGHEDEDGISFCRAVENCPALTKGEPLGTATRIIRAAGRKLTPAQRRRLVKKAGRDPRAVVIRDTRGRRQVAGL